MPAAGTQYDAIRFKVSGTEVAHLTAAGSVPGTEVLAVAATNGPGVGKLRMSSQGTRLAWRAPGSSAFGGAVDVHADGTYLLLDGEDPAKWARVQVWADYVLGAATAEILLAELYGNGISSDDVTAGEASAGDVSSYTVDVHNDSPHRVERLRVWIDAAVSGIEISDDGATWVTPTTDATALQLGALAAGGSVTLHMRRTIGSGSASDPAVETLLHHGFETF